YAMWKLTGLMRDCRKQSGNYSTLIRNHRNSERGPEAGPLSLSQQYERKHHQSTGAGRQSVAIRPFTAFRIFTFLFVHFTAGVLYPFGLGPDILLFIFLGAHAFQHLKEDIGALHHFRVLQCADEAGVSRLLIAVLVFSRF